jgi:formate-dependent nitrite reductase membrane component NrfD
VTPADRPVIKPPVWKPEIPFYLYTGGLAGASAGLAALSELRGNEVLGRRAWALALAGGAVSPALLVSDLGKPSRFLNMLRMFKVTSPMSVGSWVLSGFGAAVAPAAAAAWTDLVPAPAGVAAKAAAAALGLPLATYTAALLANTAVPVWHEASGTLPAVFAAGAATSAGAAAMACTPVGHAGPARRLALAGAVAELAAVVAMERGLEDVVARPYHEGSAHKLGRAAKVLTAAGAVVTAVTGRTRGGAVAAGGLLTAGAVLERWSVFRAGTRSAEDPRATVQPQRERLAAAA